MDKRKPHYVLERIKALIRQGSYRVTSGALSCAMRDFGLSEASELAHCILHLVPGQFYKSMTTYHDSTLWQDVYHGEVDHVSAYIKVQIVDDLTVVISFKQREED